MEQEVFQVSRRKLYQAAELSQCLHFGTELGIKISGSKVQKAMVNLFFSHCLKESTHIGLQKQLCLCRKISVWWYPVTFWVQSTEKHGLGNIFNCKSTKDTEALFTKWGYSCLDSLKSQRRQCSIMTEGRLLHRAENTGKESKAKTEIWWHTVVIDLTESRNDWIANLLHCFIQVFSCLTSASHSILTFVTLYLRDHMC